MFRGTGRFRFLGSSAPFFSEGSLQVPRFTTPPVKNLCGDIPTVEQCSKKKTGPRASSLQLSLGVMRGLRHSLLAAQADGEQ